MFYFAYGSNMHFDQMRDRCPSAHFEFIARLADHRLAFTRYSKKRECGAADNLPCVGAEVWGVVFQIDDLDIGTLDKSEGYKPGRDRTENAYERGQICVGCDGDAAKPLAVWTYTV